MKSQSWFPEEGSVRRLLCADPRCPVCNGMALEIQQLLAGEKTLISPTSPGPSPGSSCLEILSMSNMSFEQSQGSQHSQELSFPSATPSMSQLMDQKSLTQSTGAVSAQDFWAEHQLKQQLQAPEVSWDTGALSSSSLEEHRIPVNQQDKKSNSKCVPEKQEAAGPGLGNKVKQFPHWINPKVKGQVHKESILLSKDKTEAKTMTKKVEKSLPSTKGPVKRPKLEKTTEEEGMTFFDAHQCLDNELHQHSLRSSHSQFQCLPHNNSKHCPQLTCATQPENPSQVSTLTSAEGTGLCKENTQSRKKDFIVSQTSASP